MSLSPHCHGHLLHAPHPQSRFTHHTVHHPPIWPKVLWHTPLPEWGTAPSLRPSDSSPGTETYTHHQHTPPLNKAYFNYLHKYLTLLLLHFSYCIHPVLQLFSTVTFCAVARVDVWFSFTLCRPVCTCGFLILLCCTTVLEARCFISL